ncbi:MAG: hypothetical protein KDA89_21740 [Planctomycetaceae bacterium]|nr:hypothetical protein [Planctomycetaceae bacterium]
MKSAGRPVDVYCNGWRPKPDHLEHELRLTDFLLHYPTAGILRGPEVDDRIRPDATMHLDGRTFHVELDTGLESHSQVRRRQQIGYTGVEDFVLYVTLSERRCDTLIRNVHDAAKPIALFTTLQSAVRNPRGEIWRDAFGKSASI